MVESGLEWMAYILKYIFDFFLILTFIENFQTNEKENFVLKYFN